MKTETLLPLVTFILGLAGALVTEALRDRRTSNRERQARQAERQAEREARQAELQRSTLLDLQDALLELSNLASSTKVARFVTGLEHFDDLAKIEAEAQEREAGSRLWEATAKVRLLVSRVQDDQARRDATKLLQRAEMVRFLGKDAADENLKSLQVTYRHVINRTGELIRERY